MVIAVTESNNIYALNAITGNIIWQRNIGAPAASGLPCGNISPLGISDTPVVDLPSRALFFDAMVDTGTQKQHRIYSLNVDTGATNPGWPVNVNTALPAFNADHHNNRGALTIVNGIVYVPFSGHFGDCTPYHGWVVGVQINNPAAVWAGRRAPLVAEFGDTREWPAMARTCLSSPEIPLAPEAFMARGNRSSGCKPARFSRATQLITGRQPIGSRSTTAIPTLAVAAQCFWMCPGRRLPSSSWRWARIAMPI